MCKNCIFFFSNMKKKSLGGFEKILEDFHPSAFLGCGVYFMNNEKITLQQQELSLSTVGGLLHM